MKKVKRMKCLISLTYSKLKHLNMQKIAKQ